MINDLLPQDDRLFGSILVAPQAPERMADHIRDIGTNDRIVQILLPGSGQKPLGQPDYWPIYEAAEDVGLPVAFHPYDEGHGVKHAPTGAGHPNWYIEWHTLMTASYIGQLPSLIAEGVFSKFDLDFVFIEGGISWLPMVMWRMDKNWRALQAQTPWIERQPSEIIKDQVRVTTQPIPEPPSRKHLKWMLEMIDAEQTLMYASDYPHWDADPPEFGVDSFPDDLRRRVRWENANEFYDLPEDHLEDQ
jgi:predicted TIM-barrel fold metal-dependent hydrolase